MAMSTNAQISLWTRGSDFKAIDSQAFEQLLKQSNSGYFADQKPSSSLVNSEKDGLL
jgi:hypothetical protein